MTTQLRSLADQMLSALAYVLDVSTGEFRVETGDHWVTAEVGDVSLSAFLDDEGVVTAYEASHVDSDEEPVRVEADEPCREPSCDFRLDQSVGRRTQYIAAARRT